MIKQDSFTEEILYNERTKILKILMSIPIKHFDKIITSAQFLITKQMSCDEKVWIFEELKTSSMENIKRVIDSAQHFFKRKTSVDKKLEVFQALENSYSRHLDEYTNKIQILFEDCIYLDEKVRIFQSLKSIPIKNLTTIITHAQTLFTKKPYIDEKIKIIKILERFFDEKIKSLLKPNKTVPITQLINARKNHIFDRMRGLSSESLGDIVISLKKIITQDISQFDTIQILETLLKDEYFDQKMLSKEVLKDLSLDEKNYIRSKLKSFFNIDENKLEYWTLMAELTDKSYLKANKNLDRIYNFYKRGIKAKNNNFDLNLECF